LTEDEALSQREAADATRGSGVRLGAEVGGRALSLLTSFLIAVGLGVEGFGVYAAVSGLAVILAELGELGLQGTAQRALVAGAIRLRDMVRAKVVLTLALVAATPLLVWAIRALFPLAWPLVPAAWQSSFQTVNQGVALLIPFVFYFALAGWSEFLGVALRARGRRGQEAGLIPPGRTWCRPWRPSCWAPSWRGPRTRTRRTRRRPIASARCCACPGRWR
jgi:O-antigen/teichoic acid export membrane protein